ncbi:MAG: sodium:alanine symporter family protein [Oscillospiraceae bacterium]|nr:sodium:alanine symporter family protein [Oscillospiraceae bacterium]
MSEFLNRISDIVWGMPTVALIVIAGLYFTARLKLPQISMFKETARTVISQFKNGEGSALSAVATSLSATVGTGSVIGVATAITLGGAGAVFWLWVSAFFGMAVAYAEGVLSIKYRRKTQNGYKGGMMYALLDGLGAEKLSYIYAALGVLASFGMGSMAQTNSFAVSLKSGLSISPWVSAVICSVVIAICIFGGSRTAGKISTYLLPVLAIGFTALTLGVIVANFKSLPAVFSKIISSAFGLKPVIGGTVGFSVKQAISVGFKRGVFSNEAGLGTTAAVHAQAENVTPHEQGLLNMFEVVVDTFVICTLTALAILSSNSLASGLDGAELVSHAVKSVFGEGSCVAVSLSVAGFAIATAIGWSQIGKMSAQYLTHGKFMWVYNIIYIFSSLIGCLMSLEAVFTLSDIFNGLMVLPCMTALLLLSNEIIKACPSSRSPIHLSRFGQDRASRKPRGK